MPVEMELANIACAQETRSGRLSLQAHPDTSPASAPRLFLQWLQAQRVERAAVRRPSEARQAYLPHATLIIQTQPANYLSEFPHRACGHSARRRVGGGLRVLPLKTR